MPGFENYSYAISKSAVHHLTKILASKLVSEGIICNAIAPGTVHTPSWEDRVKVSKDPIKAKKDFIARQPMGRIGTPEEIAALAAFLASKRAGYITGASIDIDGGLTRYI